jgi:hypothetical protein
MLACIRLKTKFNLCASFRISVTEDEFPLINKIGVRPSGRLISPYYGNLTLHQIFRSEAEAEAGAPATVIYSAANPSDNEGSSTST